MTMRRPFSMPTEIQNPTAYYAAKEARIRANASLTRRRRLDVAIAGDGDEFRMWLLGGLTPELQRLHDASQAEFDQGIEDGPAGRQYRAEFKRYWARLPKLPAWMRESIQQWGGLTDKQLAVARRIWGEHAGKLAKRDEADAARKANAAPWSTGRQVVTGTIKSTSIRENDFGTVFKMVVETASGSRLWTTVPRELVDQVTNLNELQGRTVSIKVTVEPSKDDATFAFGSRPNLVEAKEVAA